MNEPADAGQPGLGRLRRAVVAARRRLGFRASRGTEALAGLNVAVANVPDGLANGVLVGVNPIHGLYATMFGPLVGGMTASTQRMVVTTTAAASLTAGQALAAIPPDTRPAALFMLVVLTGVVQLVAGTMGLGRLTRFVSFSVTTGFLTGVAVLLILSQLSTATGITASGGNRLMQSLYVLTHVDDANVRSVGITVLTLVLGVLLPRTPLAGLGRLLAVVLPSLLLLVPGFDVVQTVADVGNIEQSVPTPALPALAAAVDVLTGALSVAVVILVQGAGVSQSVPNQDGSRSSASRDFIAQGAANVVSGIFRGLPVGGSVSTTALSVLAGARSRWAAIFAGIWMAVIVIAVPGPIGYVAMPSLAALLILAGVSSIKPAELRAVWDSGWAPRIACVATFVSMLTLPIQAAVGIGVLLSTLMFLLASAREVTVVQLILRDDGVIEEHPAPAVLEAERVTVLDAYGDLFFAGARTLEERLPPPRRDTRPVVVLRLRGRAAAGATFIDVLTRYAETLRRAGGALYLTGVRHDAYRRLVAADRLQAVGNVHVYEATRALGESTRRAIADAERWIRERP